MYSRCFLTVLIKEKFKNNLQYYNNMSENQSEKKNIKIKI